VIYIAGWYLSQIRDYSLQ